MKKSVLAVFLFGVAFVLLSAGILKAVSNQSNVTVQVGVPDTILQVSGRTSPSSFVTVLNDGAVIGTTSSDASGQFSKTFPSQDPGLHTLKIYARDSRGSLTDTVSQNISLQAQAQTDVEFFLPPVIELSGNRITRGEKLSVSGSTIPGGKVRLFMGSKAFEILAGGDGRWDIPIGTADLSEGTHNLYAIAQDNVSTQSFPSQNRTFLLVSAAKPGAGPPGSNPGTGSESAPQPSVPVINSPINDQHFNSSPLVIEGTADPFTQIEVFDNSTPLGSAWSDEDGVWSIKIDLTKARYDLKIRSCKLNVCSLFSQAITIFYDGPQKEEDLKVSLAQYRYSNVAPKENIILDLLIEGGEPAYDITIDWGDGEIQNTILASPNNPPKFFHSYDETGNYTGKITVTDALSRTRTLTYSVEVVSQPGSNWVFPATLVAISLILIKLIPFAISHLPPVGRHIHRHP